MCLRVGWGFWLGFSDWQVGFLSGFLCFLLAGWVVLAVSLVCVGARWFYSAGCLSSVWLLSVCLSGVVVGYWVVALVGIFPLSIALVVWLSDALLGYFGCSSFFLGNLYLLIFFGLLTCWCSFGLVLMDQLTSPVFCSVLTDLLWSTFFLLIFFFGVLIALLSSLVVLQVFPFSWCVFLLAVGGGFFCGRIGPLILFWVLSLMHRSMLLGYFMLLISSELELLGFYFALNFMALLSSNGLYSL